MENAWKETRYTPIPKPEEYISHIGFIPNDPFFHNSCLAATQSGCEEFAFRTKNQLIDFVENIDFPMKKVGNKADIPFVEVSCYFYHEPNCLSYDREIIKSAESIGWNTKNYENSKLISGDRGVIDIEKAKSDRLFTAGKESILRNSYETNEEGEIIIEEYFNDEGKSIGFQPKKTRESWLRCFDPFPLSHKGNELLIGAAPETMNLFTGETNEYS